MQTRETTLYEPDTYLVALVHYCNLNLKKTQNYQNYIFLYSVDGRKTNA